MGQNASRPREVEPIAPSSIPQGTSAATEPDTGSSSAENSTPRRTRRSSVGQSLRTLIRSKSSNTLSSAESSSARQPESPSLRKRWRTSRRWSRAPNELGVDDSHTQDNSLVLSVPEESSPSEEAGMSSFPERTDGPTNGIDVSKVPSAPEISVSDQEEDVQDQETVDLPQTSTQLEQPSTSSNIGTWMDGQGSLAQALGISMEPQEDEVVISPTVFEDEAAQDPASMYVGSTPSTSAPTADPVTEPSSANAPPDNRAFPPPGTLVVVQGVVHTTDVSRPPVSAPSLRDRRSSSSTPQSSTPLSSEPASTPRSRLSSIMPRPPSMLSRPSSMFGDALAAGESGSEPTSVEDSIHEPQSPAENTSRAPVLSPSSIDVLGTLLSVAAAATATSLLNGQADSSNLNPSPSAPNAPAFTPASGLGNMSSFTTEFGPGAPPSASPSSRDRVRNVWSGLRERLRTRANTGDDPNADRFRQAHDVNALQGQTRPDGAAMDAREIMLAEMARAFNLGLGLSEEAGARTNDDAAHAPVPRSPATDAATPLLYSSTRDARGQEARAGEQWPTGQRQTISEPPESPEGSFERFLVDLQADLRVALSGPEVFAGHVPAPSSGDNTLPNMASENSTTTEPFSDNAAPPPVFRATVTDEHNDEASLEQETSVTGHGDSADNITIPEPRVSGPFGPDATASGLPGPNTTFRTEYRPGGGINWWRSYRFPPITSPLGHSPNAGGQAPAAGSSSEPPSTSFSGTAPTPLHASQTPSNPDTTEGTSNTVVPVIVVGLQSVNMDQHRGPAAFGEHTHDHDVIFGNANMEDNQAESAMGTDMNIGGTWPTDEDSPVPNTAVRLGTPQGRSWHARAANALRSLRPGRRASRTALNEGTGSRTFLIYVIGGYYPPNHSLITGADTLDSFEALWELADLLGQVKPQTVTKEEIDKSGLEIISPDNLEQYERDGKVASNCLDRCLICLDDYESQDDLRLLSCRHAFHKNCVDQWLTVGKNNCPACRTTGIPETPTASTD